MAVLQASSVLRPTVGRVWRAFGLKPHLVDAFKLSADPLFIGKVREVVRVYLDPPERALVLCADEESGIQALDRSAPVLPMMPGMPERRTHDYALRGRHAGTARQWTMSFSLRCRCAHRYRPT